MGVVYLAEQSEPIRRRVALKVIKFGMDTRQVVARFEAERHALSLMDHPNIARVIDAGGTRDGRPYFVMEYVEGAPITEYCDAHRLSTRARLELLTKVCGAVQHAHQKSVIHRDLKPSNVLVAEQDGSPVPKIIDFGIAKATQRALTDRTLTEVGQYVGTPEYMSPEQAGADGLDVDATTDIYSLGVMLYELLVGALPFDPAALRRAGYEEMRRVIREDEPEKPSTRLEASTSSDVASHRQTDPASLRRQLAGDLDWITLKTLEKDQTRRYASASELAADIGRHLNDEPVLASPPSATYRAKKFVRRNRLMVTAAGLVTGAVLGGLVVSTVLYVREGRARRDAVSAGQKTLVAEAAARREKATAESAAAAEAAARQVADDKTRIARDALASAETNLYFNNLSLIEKELAERNLARVDELLASSPPRLRNWEWHYLSRVTHMEDLAFTPLSGDLMTIGMTPNAANVLVASTDDSGLQIAVGDPATGRVNRRVRLEAPEYPGRQTTAFSPDGRRFVGTFFRKVNLAGPSEAETSVWDVSSGKVLYTLPRANGVMRLAWSSDGTRLATIHLPLDAEPGPPPIVVRDAATGVQLTSLGAYPRPVNALAFSPRGTKIAVADVAPEGVSFVTVLDAESGRELQRLAHPPTHRFAESISWSEDGRFIIGASDDDVICTWDAITGQELWSTTPVTPHLSQGAYPVAFTPDGRFLISPTRDQTLRVLDILSGAEVRRLSGHVSPVLGVTSLPGDNRLASFERGVVRIWAAPSQSTERRTLGAPKILSADSATASIAVSSDHRAVAALSNVSNRAELQIFDASSGERRLRWTSLASEFRVGSTGSGGFASVAFNRDATRAVASTLNFTYLRDGTARLDHDQLIFDVKVGRLATTLRSPLPDGALGGIVRESDLPSALTMTSVALDPTGTWAVVFTPPSARQPTPDNLTGFSSGPSTIDFWDLARRRSTRVALPGWVVSTGPEFSGDGRVAINLVGTQELRLGQRIYDIQSGRVLMTREVTTPAAFANDGIRMALQSDLRTVAILNSRSRQKQVSLTIADAPIALAFSPDDTRLAVLLASGVVTVFDTGNGRQVVRLDHSSSSLRELLVGGYAPGAFNSMFCFSSDGTRITHTTLSRDEKGALIQIRTWDGTPLRSPGR